MTNDIQKKKIAEITDNIRDTAIQAIDTGYIAPESEPWDVISLVFQTMMYQYEVSKFYDKFNDAIAVTEVAKDNVLKFNPALRNPKTVETEKE